MPTTICEVIRESLLLFRDEKMGHGGVSVVKTDVFNLSCSITNEDSGVNSGCKLIRSKKPWRNNC